MKLIFLASALCIIFSIQSAAQQSCADVDDQLVDKVTNLENADFVFAGLFPIKLAGCLEYQLEKGVERMESMIRAIQLINEDTNFLPGITIGYDMRDTCGQETVGIEEAISLVQSEFSSGNLSGIPIGVIGAASSSVSVPIASFLRVFNIPQISYASTSALLSDTDRYDYFFRTVAPDTFQALAMLDIINNFGWRFLNALYTQSTYGTPGVEAFSRAVDANNETCLDVESPIPEDDEMLNGLAMRVAISNANIVVCFCITSDANRIITAVRDYITNNIPNRTRIVWIASDAWATSEDAIEGVEEFVDGFIGVAPFAQEFQNFTEYFTNINPYAITNDLWFCGYFRERFNCEYDTMNTTLKCPNSIADASTSDYQQNNIVPFTYDATYALASALDIVLKENCEQPYNISHDQMCKEKNGNDFIKIGGETLRDALYKVNFTGTTRDFVFFDESGDGQAKYAIYNYKYNSDINFKEIGTWDAAREGKRLDIKGYNPTDNVTSYCGGIAPCKPGFETIFQAETDLCCWTCEPCRSNTYSSNTFALNCKTCPDGQWGNNPFGNNTACVVIETLSLNYDTWWAWVFLVISLIGFVGWAVVSIIYLVKWNHKVIRYSGREHCILMLIGAGICFILAFFTIAKPLIYTCTIWSLLYWSSLSLLIFPLLMKIIRIVRIFITKQNVHTKRFLSWQWQIAFSIIPVVVVLVIVIISFSTKQQVIEILVFQPTILGTPIHQLTCMDPHDAFTIIIYAMFILSVVILLFFAILTRTYPKNYRESVHIMYSSFSLIVIMFANVIIFFLLSGEFVIYRRLVQNICLMLIAATILLAFFGPRLFLVLFRDKDIKDGETTVETETRLTEAGQRAEEFKKTLAKKHPGILDPFAPYIDKFKGESGENLEENNVVGNQAENIAMMEVKSDPMKKEAQ
ncbi:metabotropic glutamate receptor 7 isoform b precursor [Oopsacas minuta]|uniref:Metabotropic glutamate receptor 7 isoform b n=1 Tax=Oopsacas minuta TaxID=111878 RepID=A0AAV7KDY2_9METZ|nr:metabotropic glutamate receptor 7 isoform b precursor [Oopsacas minuta]